MADGNPWIAVAGKFLPQTIVFLVIFLGFEFYIYHVLGFPHPGGVWPVLLLGVTTVLASQGFGLLMFIAFPGQMRMAMSACSLLGVMQFSLAGFSFPVSAMDKPFQWLSNIFPLHHYFLIYVNQALNGYHISYVWPHVIALVALVILPIVFMFRLKDAFLNKEYRA